MKLKRALIIPGFGEGDGEFYRHIADRFHARGITSELVPIKWPRTVITDNLRQFNKVYAGYDPSETVMFGYSLGATIAFLAAADRSPAALILASMAPWFAEDIPNRSAYHQLVVGKRRLATYKSLKFAGKAARLTSRTYILIGEAEAKQWPAYLIRAEAAHTSIHGSELIQISRAGHSAATLQYMQAIRSVIAEL